VSASGGGSGVRRPIAANSSPTPGATNTSADAARAGSEKALNELRVMADWLPELSDDDLATLIDALEAWEAKDAGNEFMFEMLTDAITSGNPRAQAQMDDKLSALKLKRNREAALRKERSVLLRAKLLTLRDRRRVERAVKG
jgi:hypothetical protein